MRALLLILLVVLLATPATARSTRPAAKVRTAQAAQPDPPASPPQTTQPIPAPQPARNSFAIERLADGVYAAIALPGGRATSNAFIVEGEDFVVVAGAHWTREATAELVAAVATVTFKPIRYFVLTHHHRGYSHIDFDFPPGKEVIMSWPTWQALDEEVREVSYPAIFFGEGLTLKLGKQTVILSGTAGHTDGDVLVYVPEARVLFASDLLYVRSVGYMGDGRMQQWLVSLEFIEQLQAARVVPGYGPPVGGREVTEFKTYLRAFLTAVLRHIERGDSLEQTVRTFTLPGYRDYEGYDRFLKTNVERAYRELKENLAD
jgi:glyoxylase-like metal-dependent hydrolase (beta-lactamase superfamily II)